MTSERLVTLLELLRFYADNFVNLVIQLGTSMNTLREGANIWEDGEHRMALENDLQELKKMCVEGELPVTEQLVNGMITAFTLVDRNDVPPILKEYAKSKTPNDMWTQDLYILRDRLKDELATKLYFQVQHARRGYFESPLKGWEQIIKRFPECVRDIEEMNKCFALSRYSAAMFHATNIAEWGAIHLGRVIGVTDEKEAWGPTQRAVSKLVKDGHSKYPHDQIVSFSFIEQIHREMETMVFAWRHKINHAANALHIAPNAEFTPDIAEHIMRSVKVFMERLRDGLPE